MSLPETEPTNREVVAEGHRLEAENRGIDLADQVIKLHIEVHALKGGLAANTSITLGTAEAVDAITKTLAMIDVPALVDALQAVQAMKGGVKVLGWIERPAKWIAAVTGAAVALWAAWHNWGK